MARNPPSYRMLSPSENVKAGFTRTARRYVRADIKRVTKAVKTISYRTFIKRTKDATPEQLAREHLSGVRPYVSQARREQAAKTRAAAELKHIVKKIDRLHVVRNMSPNERKGGGKTWHLLPDARTQKGPRRSGKSVLLRWRDRIFGAEYSRPITSGGLK